MVKAASSEDVSSGLAAGSITSATHAEDVARLLSPSMCPEGSQAQVHTFATTSRDERGFEQPATSYEGRCLNARVRNRPAKSLRMQV